MHHYTILKHKRKDIDNIIKTNYSASVLNNTKWVKLLETLIKEFEYVYINYKLIYDDEIKGLVFSDVDTSPFFIEPILYKEVEWIELPNTYETWINPNNLKAGKTTSTQDINAIETVIKGLGQFKMDVDQNKIRVYAYMK